MVTCLTARGAQGHEPTDRFFLLPGVQLGHSGVWPRQGCRSGEVSPCATGRGVRQAGKRQTLLLHAEHCRELRRKGRAFAKPDPREAASLGFAGRMLAARCGCRGHMTGSSLAIC